MTVNDGGAGGHQPDDDPHAGDRVSNDRPDTVDRGRTVTEWAHAGDVFGSIVAGLLLGLLGDRVLGTEPWLVIFGVTAGFAVGFWRMYERSKEIVDEAMRRQRYARGSGDSTPTRDEDDWGSWTGA